MKLLRFLLMPALVLAVPACGTKSPLLTPQCSKEEKVENGVAAPADEKAACGKLAKARKNPSEPPNPISR